MRGKVAFAITRRLNKKLLCAEYSVNHAALQPQRQSARAVAEFISQQSQWPQNIHLKGWLLSEKWF